MLRACGAPVLLAYTWKLCEASCAASCLAVLLPTKMQVGLYGSALLLMFFLEYYNLLSGKDAAMLP